MENPMVKEHSLSMMEVSMWGNISMGIGMVKEHSLSIMAGRMYGNGDSVKHGTPQITTKKETHLGKM